MIDLNAKVGVSGGFGVGIARASASINIGAPTASVSGGISTPPLPRFGLN